MEQEIWRDLSRALAAVAACLAALAALVHVASASEEGTFVFGLDFVTEPQPIDAKNVFGIEANFMIPWPITPDSRYVTEGGFAGMTEAEIQHQILHAVRNKYYEVPTPDGMELDIEFVLGRVEGLMHTNVLFGEYNVHREDIPGDHWFGIAGGGSAEESDGNNLANVALDSIQTLPGPFDTFDASLNGIAHVAAHEIGHTLFLWHVCAGEGSFECEASDPKVSDPFPVMGTGPTGLTDADWLEDNKFTTVPNTQANGHSSVSLLIDVVGLRKVADSDKDGDVDSADTNRLLTNWTGALLPGSGDRGWRDGDADHDGDVDVADMTLLIMNWTGSLLSAHQAEGELAYDPRTGTVSLKTQPGASIVSFAIAADSDQFVTANAQLPFASTGVNTDVSSFQIAQYDPGMVGQPGAIDLGPILPIGWDLEELTDAIANAQFSVGQGSGGNLQITVIPEPAAGLLALIALLVPLTLRRRRD